MNDVVQYTVNDLRTMANTMAASNFWGFKRPEEAMALMLVAQAEGKHPATIAQEYDVIQGRPAIKSSAALARFQHAGGTIRWIVSTPSRAEAEFSHPQGGTLVIAWDMERARTAGLAGKDNWKKFPDQMLRARVVSEGVRAVFPGCLNGLYLDDEVRDFDQRPMSPAPQSQSPVVADAVVMADQARVAALFARIAEIGYPEEQVDAVLQGTKTADMTHEQFVTLGKAVVAWESQQKEQVQ